MPLYEYECESCANRFERIQKFSDPPVETCPACSGPVRKLLSSPAIQFKGSGWYITDYARKGGNTDKPATPGKTDGGGDKADTPGKSEKAATGSDSTAAAPAKSEKQG